MKRFRMAGRTVKLLMFAAIASGALSIGVTSSFGATPSTPYRTVTVDSPDPITTPQNDPTCPQPVPPNDPGDPNCVTSLFGTRLSAGDMTGDGIQDIVVGSYSQDLPASQVGGVVNNNAGRATLIDGATQKVVWKVTPEPQADSTYGFGFYVSVTGDVNGDGKEDIAVGSVNRDVGSNANQGRAYQIDGATGAVIRTIDSPDPQANGGFGARIGAAGDVTGDGVPDIIIGANGHDLPAGCGNTTPQPVDCLKNVGQAYIFNGATGAKVRTLNLPAGDAGGCSATGRCSFGGTVQSPGDVNKDGFPDQTVAAYAYGSPGPFTGRVYLFSGGGPTAGQVLARIDPPVPEAFDFFGLEDPDRNAPGDLNADGTNDLYFDAFGAGGVGGHDGAGRAWTFDGAATVATGTGVVLSELNDPLLGDNRAFGWANSKTDYNKDGRPDLFVSNLSDQNTSVSIFDGRNGSELKRLNTPAADVAEDPNGAIGWSSRALGDVNGDCEPDYVAGAPYQDAGGQIDQGKVYFFLSNVPGGSCPAGPSTGLTSTSASTTGAIDKTAPTVTGYGLTNNPFAVGGSTPTFGSAARKRKHKKGTTFKYTLSETATAKFVIAQRRPGRRKGKRCVAPTRKLRHARKCTRLFVKGTLTRTSRKGANRVAFSGRIGSKALKPGRYQATLTATDSSKNTSKAKTIAFTIVRR